MSPHRRLVVTLVVLAALAIPALALRAACVGASCDAGARAAGVVPFCGLPAVTRQLIADGYREGRSPDVLAVTQPSVVGPTETANGAVPWPRAADPPTAVPLVFWGAAGDAPLDGVTLDRVAPTIADAIGLARPFPAVRSGTAIPGVATSVAPRLVLLIGWKGVGADTLAAAPRDWPFLRRLIAQGTGTTRASAGSLPLEPTAVLTTIGAGALPRQHGVTGPVVRDDAGIVVDAYGPSAPTPVLASLGDDITEGTRGRVAMAAADRLDRGLVGAGWYDDGPAPPVAEVDTAGAIAATEAALDDGFGGDAAPDLFAVSLDDDMPAMDDATRRIVQAASIATSDPLLVVVVGTGAATTGLPAGILDDAIAARSGDLVEAVVAGGWFLDQDVMRSAQLTSHDVVEAVAGARDDDGTMVTSDVFQDFSISFNRYC